MSKRKAPSTTPVHPVWTAHHGPTIETTPYARLLAHCPTKSAPVNIALVALDHPDGMACAQLLKLAPRLYRLIEQVEGALIQDIEQHCDPEVAYASHRLLEPIQQLIKELSEPLRLKSAFPTPLIPPAQVPTTSPVPHPSPGSLCQTSPSLSPESITM